MPQSNIKKKYLMNLINQILSMIVPLITVPYVSRILGPDGVGRYSYTTSIVTYFVLLGSAGTAIYGLRKIAYVRDNIEEMSRIFWEIVLLRLSFVIISLVVFFFTVLSHSEYSSLLWVQGINIIAVIFDISWFYQGLEDFKKIVLRDVCIKVVGLIAILSLIKKQDDLPLYILCISLITLVGNTSLWSYLGKILVPVSLVKLKFWQHLPESLVLLIPQGAVSLYTVLDKTMIGIITKSNAENGYYEQSQAIVRFCVLFVTSLGLVMFPRMANAFVRHDEQQIKRELGKSFQFVWFLGTPFMLGLLGTATHFVPWFLGAQFEKVSLLIIVLCPLPIAIGLSNVLYRQFLLPMRKNRACVITLLVAAGLNFVANLFLIKAYQSLGAAMASVVTEIGIVILMYPFTRSLITLKMIFRNSLRYIFSGLFMLAVLLVTGKYVENSICGTLGLVFIGCFVYFIPLFLIKDEYLFKILEFLKIKRM